MPESHKMRLSFYFFRQYLPSFAFGVVLFSFVFLLDKMFDLIDLILNKGVEMATIFKLLGLFIPTAFPLAFPMAILLACMVSFGRMSEENEVTAVRAAGISLLKVLWVFPLFAFLLSISLIPFNTTVAPWINRSFRAIYEQIIQADPLIKISPKKFFSIKNIKIFAHSMDLETNTLRDLFVYQLPKNGRPPERIFARSGVVDATKKDFKLVLKAGQLQRYDLENPNRLIHTTFGEYTIHVPLKLDKQSKSTRFRYIPSNELKKLLELNRQQMLSTTAIDAELQLRTALAFAPICLMIIGIPLATALKKGGKAFNVAISVIVIFIYYLTLIFGLTIAEKGLFHPVPSLWLANTICLLVGAYLIKRLVNQ